jgi:predicted kinase
MTKVDLSKPVLLCLYGFPGSGKSYMARNLVNSLHMVNISADRIRNELFERPRYDTQEDAVISHLMNYMTEEFLNAEVSVVYDTNALRVAQRRKLHELAQRHKAEYLLVWLQIDVDSAFARTQDRDRRTNDDKYAEPQSRLSFDKKLTGMQNPQNENYLVVSGKHSFPTQKSSILNKLYQMGLTSSGSLQGSMAAPGLVNLVPNPHAGRVDFTRRNITIG